MGSKLPSEFLAEGREMQHHNIMALSEPRWNGQLDSFLHKMILLFVAAALPNFITDHFHPGEEIVQNFLHSPFFIIDRMKWLLSTLLRKIGSKQHLSTYSLQERRRLNNLLVFFSLAYAQILLALSHQTIC